VWKDGVIQKVELLGFANGASLSMTKLGKPCRSQKSISMTTSLGQGQMQWFQSGKLGTAGVVSCGVGAFHTGMHSLECPRRGDRNGSFQKACAGVMSVNVC